MKAQAKAKRLRSSLGAQRVPTRPGDTNVLSISSNHFKACLASNLFLYFVYLCVTNG